MLKHLVCEIDDCFLHLYTDESVTERLLKEAADGKGRPLTGIYYFRKDPPHVPPGQYHLHVYKKKNQLFSINWDGTAHDQSHGEPIPNKVYHALQAKFPGLDLPSDRVIESMSPLALGMTIKTITKTGMSFPEMVELQMLINEIKDDS